MYVSLGASLTHDPSSTRRAPTYPILQSDIVTLFEFVRKGEVHTAAYSSSIQAVKSTLHSFVDLILEELTYRRKYSDSTFQPSHHIQHLAAPWS